MKRVYMMLFFSLWLPFLHGASTYQGEALFVHLLSLYVPVSSSVLKQLNKLVSPFKETKIVVHKSAKKLPIFKEFPGLVSKIAYEPVCSLPSPVKKLSVLGDYVHINELAMKDDGALGLGGTKNRKFGFLFGQALHHGAKSIVTLGSAGSNLAAAAAACCQKLGLKSISLLKPQPNSRTVRRNLLLMDYYGSQLQYCPNIEVRGMGATYTFFRQKEDYGDFPYIIPPGGSCPIGVIGIINAVLELQEQIKQGHISEPDRIYVAASTLGTVAGLLLGTKIAKLPSRIIGISVMPEMKAEGIEKLIMQLCNETAAMLHGLDPQFPLVKIQQDEIHMLYDFRGTEYGLFTPQGVEMIKMLKEKEGVVLDGTYTGKAFAGMLEDVKKNNCQKQNILFWNTFYGDDCSTLISENSYKKLPKALHSYFETNVQELDRG